MEYKVCANEYVLGGRIWFVEPCERIVQGPHASAVLPFRQQYEIIGCYIIKQDFSPPTPRDNFVVSLLSLQRAYLI
jgi:hypothetical protein